MFVRKHQVHDLSRAHRFRSGDELWPFMGGCSSSFSRVDSLLMATPYWPPCQKTLPQRAHNQNSLCAALTPSGTSLPGGSSSGLNGLHNIRQSWW